MSVSGFAKMAESNRSRKPAYEWIQVSAYLEKPVEFHDAVEILGPHLWEYLEQELEVRDSRWDRFLMTMQRKIPWKIF
jgi:hypothetical protein